MRILFVNPGGSATGGAERSLSLLIRGLAERGHDLAAVTLLPGDASDAFKAAGATIMANGVRTGLAEVRRHGSTRAFVNGVLRTVPEAVATAEGMRKFASLYSADIVHSNGLRTHALTPLLARDNPRVVWSLRERPPSSAARRIIRAAARTGAATIATSAFAAEVVSRCRRPVYVIPNPVDDRPLLDRRAARLSLGLAPGRPVVSVVAHLHPTKGHHVVVAAWSDLPPPRPMLLLAGGCLYGDASRNYREGLQRAISACDLEADVLLTGTIPDVERVYAASDIVVHPALYPEGFGRSIAEAQVAGVPVIATRIGAAPELIHQGRTGLLVAPNDTDAVGQMIRRVLDDPALRARLRKGGLAVAARYSVAAHAQAVESVYQAVSA